MPCWRGASDGLALLPDVARRLLGEPPRTEAGGTTWRYGNRGSLAVHVAAAAPGTWHDFEADESGGTLALVQARRPRRRPALAGTPA